MKLTGTLVYRDLGAGAWTLQADDGAVYDLDVANVDRRSLDRSRGQRIQLTGRKADRMGFGMGGSQTLVVGSVRPSS
jgi:hypothetical protein